VISEEVVLEEPFLSCRSLLEDLMEHESSQPFNEPVDEELTDYFEVVKNPMDLGTIRDKLNSHQYKTTEFFVDDVRLVFDNCLLYNEPSSEIGISAQILWSFFKRNCKKYDINLRNEKKILSSAKMSKNDLSNLEEELKLKSDLQIHLFCNEHECLRKFLFTEEQILNSSGKLIVLKKKLMKAHSRNSRCLIFSQFTEVLNILGEFIKLLGYKYLRLDGSTPVLDRQTLIDEYNNDGSIFVFLLSTRAGGLGINLTSADVCIFHDIDWNPEMDRQAEARCHRLGQLKPVKVIKLLSKESVDEYILKMAQKKKQRNDLVMGGNEEKQLTEEEVDKLNIGEVLASIFKNSLEKTASSNTLTRSENSGEKPLEKNWSQLNYSE